MLPSSPLLMILLGSGTISLKSNEGGTMNLETDGQIADTSRQSVVEMSLITESSTESDGNALGQTESDTVQLEGNPQDMIGQIDGIGATNIGRNVQEDDTMSLEDVSILQNSEGDTAMTMEDTETDTSTSDSDKYPYIYNFRHLLQVESNLSDNFRSGLNNRCKSLLEKFQYFEDYVIPLNKKYIYTEKLRCFLWIQCILSDKFRSTLNELCFDLSDDDDFFDDVRSFFEEELDIKKHSEEDVTALIHCIPFILDPADPQTALYYDPLLACLTRRVESVPFIPLVADIARTYVHCIGDPRGGLLCTDRNEESVIELLCCDWLDLYRDPVHDPVYLATMRDLREMDLLKKEDIREKGLLLSCCEAFVDFFTDWDPGALKTKYNICHFEECLHHDNIACLIEYCEDTDWEEYSAFLRIKQIIKASFRHYPDELGLLMLRDRKGSTVWEELIVLLVWAEEAWEIVENSINDTSHDKVICEESTGEDQNVVFAPLFTAAVVNEERTSLSIDIDFSILYYLMRKEPSKWIAYLDE